MAAKIIQTDSTPFKTVELDSIALDIIENALRNARTEMDAVLFRTAMSPGIREQHDAFPMIANNDGKMVVGQFGSFIHGFVHGYEGTIEEGDIFLTNDPYSCNGAVSHLNDWLT
jgi:N-methylhydantoinase B